MERRTNRKAKYFIIPILVVAFVTAIAAPPAHAELVTLTVILAVAFASAVVAKNVVNSNQDKETAQNPTNPIQTSRQALIIQNSNQFVNRHCYLLPNYIENQLD
ncbi:MAG: hypothetical protein WBR24_07520 [Desulfobacterales bacterium]|jgi:uncharacterized membrane protein